MAPDEISKSLPEILTPVFCDQAARRAIALGVQLIPEEVLEILGGIVDLYLNAFIKARQSEITATTRRAFVSQYASESEVLLEIQNCAGVQAVQTNLVLSAMEDALKLQFNELGITSPGKLVRFKPLGKLEVIDLEASSYRVTYRDPAADSYDRFFLNRTT